MAKIKFEHIYKDYVLNQHVVNNFNLDIDDKEFIVFVGPSGCGKSTTLRMIAGLEDITSGQISIDGKVINDLHPKDRDIAMVFQNYALYPHMSVYENMAFGLKLKKAKTDEIDDRVRDVAEILDLTPYLERLPKELSGGQMQRVALGRAIVKNAKVFLMDEPLSNLDAKLRTQTRAELIKLHHTLGATTIYVTHDQTEAMTMASRIVVMRDGIVQQVGTPKEIYLNPANKFVAGFIGAPAMNFVEAEFIDNALYIGRTKLLNLPENIYKALIKKNYNNKSIILGTRPEDISLSDFSVNPNQDNFTYLLKTKVDIAELTGSETLIHYNIGEFKQVAKINSMDDFKIDSNINLLINLQKAHFFDIETENKIYCEEV